MVAGRRAGNFPAGDDPATPTVVYIHGNRTDADEAAGNGCYVDRAIQCQAAGRPFRFVIWSWPADGPAAATGPTFNSRPTTATARPTTLPSGLNSGRE